MLAVSAVGGLIVLVFLIGLYFIPTMIAFDRKIPNRNSVAVINVFLGWTLLGWIAALAMAVSGSRSQAGATDSPAAPASVPPVSGGLSVNELERLSELHASGALSDDEFQRAKQRLLGEP